MARLPSEMWLVQQNGGMVTIFNDSTGEEIASFDPSDSNTTARVQKVIYDSKLSPEDKCFAHFWCGYFYAYACMAREV